MNLNYPDLDYAFGYAADSLFPEEAAARRRRDEYHPSKTQTQASCPGDWRYFTARRGKSVVLGSMIFSAAFHGFLFFGSTGHPKAKPVLADTGIVVSLIAMPVIKEEDVAEEPGEASDAPAGMEAPMLPDIPPSVVIDGAFTQAIDMSTFIQKPNFDGAKLNMIPTVIKRGGIGGAGKLREIFDLANLDRVPTAIMQASPRVPPNVRHRDTPVTMDIQFIVTSKGEVVDVQVINSDAPEFNDVAIMAIEKWKFKPGIKSGRSVNSRMRQPMRFRFNESE